MSTKFVIVKLGYVYEDKDLKPYAGCENAVYDSYEEADEALKNRVSTILSYLNKDRDIKPFKLDWDGDNTCIIRFWDGDDYQIVEAYNIVSFHNV